MEEWRIIAEATDYAVSSIGRVKRVKPDRLGRGLGKILNTPIGDAGYPCCSLHVNRKQLHRRIYQLVCRAFHGPKPTPKHEVRHLDGSKTNSAASNLAWGTSAENTADCVRHGTLARGERLPQTKLTEVQVAAIRESSEHYRSIADKFGISPNYVHTVRRCGSWQHV